MLRSSTTMSDMPANPKPRKVLATRTASPSPCWRPESNTLGSVPTKARISEQSPGRCRALWALVHATSASWRPTGLTCSTRLASNKVSRAACHRNSALQARKAAPKQSASALNPSSRARTNISRASSHRPSSAHAPTMLPMVNRSGENPSADSESNNRRTGFQPRARYAFKRALQAKDRGSNRIICISLKMCCAGCHCLPWASVHSTELYRPASGST
mmetsp:Transcript_138413/g.441550  ORF Transcript_138413/g.441550 Transcript_138413/m.441550 type:complete len:217 (-) Transcript_138413:603-1253(-)